MALIDKQLILSDNQHLSCVTGPETYNKYYVSQNYVDLGALGIDPGIHIPGGIAPPTAPGFWNVRNLILHVGTGATYTTAFTPSIDDGLRFIIRGVHETSQVTSEFPSEDGFEYLFSPYFETIWWENIGNLRLYDITIPRFYHRYLFLLYHTQGTAEVKMNAWINTQDEFSYVTKGIKEIPW